MAEREATTDSPTDSGANLALDQPAAVPPKRLPPVLMILLMLLLPAAAAGIWLGGRLHSVDGRPAATERPTLTPLPTRQPGQGSTPEALQAAPKTTESASGIDGSVP